MQRLASVDSGPSGCWFTKRANLADPRCTHSTCRPPLRSIVRCNDANDTASSATTSLSTTPEVQKLEPAMNSEPRPYELVDYPGAHEPKFQPFIARDELWRRVTTFHRDFDLQDGSTLLVLPVSERWVDDVAELLTDTFASSMGWQSVYKNFLKRQVRAYVRHHMALPPKAVVLLAFLVPPLPSPTASAATSNLPSQDGFGERERTAGTSSPPSSVSSMPSMDFDLDNPADFGDGMAMGVTSSDEDTAVHPSYSGDAGDASQNDAPSNAALVGCLEVSFAESTRSKYFTLNPPPDRPYICNMAVALEHRCNGYGAKLLQAAEELVALMGENCAYLHLRLKDAPAAALYRSAGYKDVATDSPLVVLLGLDRRYLMKKEIAT